MSELFTDKHISAFQQNDERAIQALFKEHYAALVNTADKLVNDKAEAREIVLTTFTKLIALRANFQSVADIKAYLLVSTRSACYDYLSAVGSGQPASKDILRLADLLPPAAVPEPHPVNTDTILAIYHIMESLPPEEAELFRELFFNKVTPVQAASYLGITAEEALTRKTALLTFFHQQICLHSDNIG